MHVIRVLAFSFLGACGSKTDRPAPAPAPPVAPLVIDAPPPPALSPAMQERWREGCFLLRTSRGLVENDRERCAKGRRPYSTFKLANALIALDAKLLDGPDAQMAWDKQRVRDEKRYFDSWRKPHTLRSGMKVSAVPHFRTLALDLGEQRMAAGLATLDYGNRSMGGGLDQFWLRGDLRVSATQQLAFVDRLARGTLAVSKEAQAAVREISELETKDERTLHGKTGSGRIEDGEGWLMWQVGWIEHAGEIEPYAAWIEVRGVTFDEARAAREQLLRATFTELGVF
jgi:beta-lactamase class D